MYQKEMKMNMLYHWKLFASIAFLLIGMSQLYNVVTIGDSASMLYFSLDMLLSAILGIIYYFETIDNNINQ
jgi:hypothetical protein